MARGSDLARGSDMARGSDLVKIMADHNVDTEPTLELFWRQLRDGGRVRKAKRGYGAAEANALDAARYLIAAGGTDRPARAAEAEAYFSGAVVDHQYSLDAATNDKLLADIAARGLHLDAAVETLLLHLPEAARKGLLYLEFDRANGSAEIALNGARLQFSQPAAIEMRAAIDAALMRGEDVSDFVDTYSSLGRFGSGKNVRVAFYADILVALAKAVRSGSNTGAASVPLY